MKNRAINRTLLPVVLMALLAIVTTDRSKAQESLTAESAYDAFGFRTSLVSGVGGIRSFDHGHAGVETGVRLNGASVVEDAAFGSHGQLERFTYGALDGRPRRTARRAFDGLNRPTALSLQTEGATGYDYRADTFGYGVRSLVTGFIRSDRAVGDVDVGFDYTAQGALDAFAWGSASVRYRYDPRGNLIARTADLGVPNHDATYDRQNRNADWRYDGAGRLLADDAHRYEYDTKGRLRMLRDKDSGAWLAHYLYDDQGFRVRVLEPDRVTYVQRDEGGAVIAEDVRDRRHQAAETREHVLFNGGAVLEVTQVMDGATTKTQRFTDRLGNPVVTWTAGKTSFHEYSPFGHAMAVGATSAHTGAFGFTGHEDDASGLTYMRARYYDADAARFNQPDPGRDVDPLTPSSYNLYQYARNNPVVFVDPDGRVIETAWDIINIGIGISSFVDNVGSGNFLGAALDLGGVILDTAAAVAPGVPGGVSTALAMGRRGDDLYDLARAAGIRLENATIVKTRVSKRGERGVQIINEDGSVIDITTGRVKMTVPETHPSAPSGTPRDIKFENAQKGTKGKKRDPTPEELEFLEALWKEQKK